MKKFYNIIIGFIITLFILMCLGISRAETIAGKARVIDGDTIEINNEKIRLACVDTPESNYRGKTQYCLDNETDCGKLAKEALQNMIGTHEVWCDYTKRDVYGRILATCQEYNFFYTYGYYGTFNYALIEQGYAWYYNGSKECKKYEDAFIEAKKEGYGLFNEEFGGFKEPKLWRKTRTND